jgi:hypothetical protein
MRGTFRIEDDVLHGSVYHSHSLEHIFNHDILRNWLLSCLTKGSGTIFVTFKYNSSFITSQLIQFHNQIDVLKSLLPSFEKTTLGVLAWSGGWIALAAGLVSSLFANLVVFFMNPFVALAFIFNHKVAIVLVNLNLPR